jgi:hypothetical protein
MTTHLSCACGRFEMELEGDQFIATECHCNSCREAGERLGKLPLSRPMLESNGGTQFVLYRKDRVKFPRGQYLLGAFRLKPDSPTRRVVSTCCSTPLFLEFQGGHWLSIYSTLWPEGTAPRPELRTMTGDRPPGSALDESLPAGRVATLGFYGKLLGAWIAMGFKSPKIEISREIEA